GRARDEQGRLASRGADLERSLLSRLELEDAAAQAADRAHSAEETVREAARACAIDAGDASEILVQKLARWQRERTAAQAERQNAINEWAELEAILAGRTIDDLRREASVLHEAAQAKASGLDPVQFEELVELPDLEAELAERRQVAAQAESTANRLRGQL